MTFAVPSQLLPTYITLRGAVDACRCATAARVGAGAASAPTRPTTAVPTASAAQTMREAVRRMGLLEAGIDTRPTSQGSRRYERATLVTRPDRRGRHCGRSPRCRSHGPLR